RAIGWVVVRFCPRCGAADGIGKSQNPVIRDKRIFDDHVKASGSAETHRTPAFPIDLVVGLWNQGESWHWPALGPYRQHRPAEIPDCKAMPWKKGQSGNPLGRLPGEKQFADQLRIVLAEPVDKNDPKSVRKLRRIAEKLAECALNGEPWAIAQVADRIDGKATAEIKTEQTQRYVAEVPEVLTREQWIQKYSPSPPIGTSTPS